MGVQAAAPAARRGLEVTFEYGDDGILTVTILDPLTQARQHFAVRHATAEPLTDEQMEKMRSINESLVERTTKFESNTQYNDALDVLRKAEKTILPKVTDEMEKMRSNNGAATPAGDGERRSRGDGAAYRPIERSAFEPSVSVVTDRVVSWWGCEVATWDWLVRCVVLL